MNLALKYSLTPDKLKNITYLHSPVNIAANESFYTPLKSAKLANAFRFFVLPTSQEGMNHNKKNGANGRAELSSRIYRLYRTLGTRGNSLAKFSKRVASGTQGNCIAALCGSSAKNGLYWF